jgi:hypothetical protein
MTSPGGQHPAARGGRSASVTSEVSRRPPNRQAPLERALASRAADSTIRCSVACRSSSPPMARSASSSTRTRSSAATRSRTRSPTRAKLDQRLLLRRHTPDSRRWMRIAICASRLRSGGKEVPSTRHPRSSGGRRARPMSGHDGCANPHQAPRHASSGRNRRAAGADPGDRRRHRPRVP